MHESFAHEEDQDLAPSSATRSTRSVCVQAGWDLVLGGCHDIDIGIVFVVKYICIPT